MFINFFIIICREKISRFVGIIFWNYNLSSKMFLYLFANNCYKTNIFFNYTLMFIWINIEDLQRCFL